MIDKFNPLLLVAIGAVFGALSRYILSVQLKSFLAIPAGTLTVNVLGSFFLGFLVTLQFYNFLDNSWLLLLGTGFMGSFTTMSTFVVETLRLGNESSTLALSNLILTLVFAFVGGYSGQILGNIYVKQVSGL